MASEASFETARSCTIAEEGICMRLMVSQCHNSWPHAPALLFLGIAVKLQQLLQISVDSQEHLDAQTPKLLGFKALE